jgi:hypothetical protein
MGLRKFTKALAINEIWPIAAAGDTVRCTEGDLPFDLRLNKPSSDDNPLAADFDRLEVTNGGTAQTVTLYVGTPDHGRGGQETFQFQNGFGYSDSTLQDSRLTGQVNITGGLSTKVSGSSTIGLADPNVTASAASLVAESAASRLVLIRPIDGDIHIGHSTGVTITNGFLVKTGEVFNYTSGDELFAIAAATVDVRLFTETYT